MFSRFRSFTAFTLFLGLLLGTFADSRAALLEMDSHVKAALVALDETVQPGKPVTVALRLQHEAHWHTYWINPGTGYPTSIKWDLPMGWQAGEIQWPVPSIIKDHLGNITGNGYEGVTYLPVTLTAPANLAPGTKITLKGKADWLMCADTCVPGDAIVSLTLTVSDAAPKPLPLREKILAAPPMPQKPDGWQIAATRAPGAKTVTLTISKFPAGSNGAHFFSADALIQYDQPQTAAINAANNTLTLTLPVSDSYEGEGKRLVGVITLKDSKGVYRGYDIDVLLNSTANAAANTAASASTSASATVNAGTPPAAQSSSLSIGSLLLAFVGGLILNLMPCVFPVIGIKIMGFVNQAGSSRRKVTMHGVAFAIGVIVSFWILAGALFLLSPAGEKLGWGYQLQFPWFVFGLTAVMLLFALNMSGLFEIGLSMTSAGGKLQTKEGYAGSFFTGALAVVVATPCSAPFLGPALGAALVLLSRAEAFIVFTAIALGLAAPYLLLSIFPGAVKFLPRPGAWMETFKQFMAFLLYGTVAYLLWVLIGQTSENEYAILWVLFGLVLIAMAGWIYGRFGQSFTNPRRRGIGLVGAAVFLVAGVWFGWPRPVAQLKAANQIGEGAQMVTTIVWEKWSPQAVAAAQAAGKIVYVDFTARWCATCQSNKFLVFNSDEVLKFFSDNKVVALKADWTNRNAEIAAELARFNRSAVPFNLVYKPGKSEPVVLPELLTPGIVLDALR